MGFCRCATEVPFVRLRDDRIPRPARKLLGKESHEALPAHLFAYVPAGGQSARVEGLPYVGVVPREPILDSLSDGVGVLLEGHQVIEGIDSIELTGVNNAHEEVPDPSTSESHKGQGILPMQNRHLQSAFDRVIVQRAPGTERKRVRGTQCLSI